MNEPMRDKLLKLYSQLQTPRMARSLGGPQIHHLR